MIHDRFVTAVILVTLAACGSDDSPGFEAAPTATTVAPAPTTTEAPTTTLPPRTEYPLGETLEETPSGNEITLLAYEQPWSSTNQFIRPAPGTVFATIDVKGCAGPEEDPYGFNPFEFELAMPDSTRIDPTLSSREPRLSSGPLQAGDCVRGWITFEVPRDVRASHVVVTRQGQTAKWRVP